MAKKDAIEPAIPREIVPEYITTGDTRGTEHITKDDVRLPRLTLAQAMSPQLQPEDPGYIDGLKPGQVFNDLTGKIYELPVELVVVRADPPRWIEFDNDRNIVEINIPVGDPRTISTTDADGKWVRPQATKFYDYVGLVNGRELVCFSFKSTGLRTARTLNGLIRMKQVPVFAQKFAFSPVKQKNDLGTWYVFAVRQAGFVDEETYRFAEDVFRTISEKKVEFETSFEEDESGTEAM